MRLERDKRLRRAADIQRILRQGRRRRMQHLELIWTQNSAGLARMGLIVPKFHHTAVARNRLRRRLREIWRTEVQGHQGTLDLLIRARREAYAAPLDTLKTELHRWRDAVQSGP